MRLIVLVAIAFIPLIASSPIELGDGFSLPALENVESHVDNLWANFKKGYGIIYNSTVEEVHRFKIFATHVKLIIQHNIEHDLGLHTYRLGINKYATLVKENDKKRIQNCCFYFRQMKNFVIK
jgi:hypothetical protein